VFAPSFGAVAEGRCWVRQWRQQLVSLGLTSRWAALIACYRILAGSARLMGQGERVLAELEGGEMEKRKKKKLLCCGAAWLCGPLVFPCSGNGCCGVL